MPKTAELSGGDGVTFDTLTGSVTIPGEAAERWVSWKATDGVTVLESASRFMAKHGLVAPGRPELLVFLAEYARWVAHGHDDTKLVELARGFIMDWAEKARAQSKAAAADGEKGGDGKPDGGLAELVEPPRGLQGAPVFENGCDEPGAP